MALEAHRHVIAQRREYFRQGLGRRSTVALGHAVSIEAQRVTDRPITGMFQKQSGKVGRVMKADEMRQIASWISEVLADPENESAAAAVRNRVKELSERFPIYENRLVRSHAHTT